MPHQAQAETAPCGGNAYTILVLHEDYPIQTAEKITQVWKERTVKNTNIC